MTQIARYVIVLDRYDDDDYLQADAEGHGLNDGTEAGGCAQVAAELQEAMEQHGTPAGFFNVIAREVSIYPPDHTHVPLADPAELREPTAAMLLKSERTQGPPGPPKPCIERRYLGGTETVTFDDFATQVVQDHELAREIAAQLAASDEPYKWNEDSAEFYEEFRATNPGALRAQLGLAGVEGPQ